MRVVYCDNRECGRRIFPEDHMKVDVLNRRYDCHRGACMNVFNEFKARVDRIAAGQVANLKAMLDAEEKAFWKGANEIGIPEKAPR